MYTATVLSHTDDTRNPKPRTSGVANGCPIIVAFAAGRLVRIAPRLELQRVNHRPLYKTVA